MEFLRMLRVQTRVVLLVLLGLLGPGCAGFLEQEPGNQTSINELLSDWAGFEAALNGTYSELADLMSLEAFHVYADLQGGNLTFTPATLGSRQGQLTVPIAVENLYGFQDQAFESDMEFFYEGAYAVIGQANLLLERVDAVPDAPAGKIDQLKAEVLAIRSLVHFLLVRLYGQPYGYTPDASHPGVAYVTTTIPIGGPYPARATVGEVYAGLLADLAQAHSLGTETPVLSGPVYSYFSRTAIQALRARVALYAEDWPLAYDAASDVINNSGLSLTPGDQYVAEWAAPVAPLSETILELSPAVDGDGNIGSSVSAFYDYTAPGSYGDYVASADLRAAFAAGDVRGDSLYEVVEIQTIDALGEFPRPYFFTLKLQGPTGNPVLRLSELYLIQAEAAARQANEAPARAALDALRARMGQPPLATGIDLLAEILLERRRELCFEGHYFYDLGRYGQAVARGEDCIATVCELSYPSPFFVLPIPQRSLDLNANLVQNEGY